MFGGILRSVAHLGLSRWLWDAIVLAIAARVAAAFVLSFWPLKFDTYTAEAGRARLLSPLDVVGIDIEHYMTEAERIAAGTWLEHNMGDSFTPPLTPILLWLMYYGPGHTLPTAMSWLVLSCVWVAGWIVVLRARAADPRWALALAVLPTPVLYQFAIGTDLPFAVLFLLFFWSYTSSSENGRVWIWSGAVLLMAMTRAAVLSVLLFLLIDQILALVRGKQGSKATIVALVVVFVGSAIIYWPWFTTFMNPALNRPGYANLAVYFGIPETRFLGGLFGAPVPELVDRPLSWALLVTAKILYFCGFRPSFESATMLGTLLRSTFAVITLPGLLYCLWRGEERERLMVVVVLAPTLFGLTQERFSLPILPLMAFYGVAFWVRLFGRAVSPPR